MENVIPNNSGFPSAAFNNPVVMPFLGMMPDELLPFSPVPEETAIGERSTSEMFTPQGPRNLLMQMRAMFPNLPILPIPGKVSSIYLTANFARDIAIPDGSVLAILFGNGGYYMSAQGNAELPTTANEFMSSSMYAPEGYAFFVGGKRALSFISATTGTIVSMLTYSFTELPY